MKVKWSVILLLFFVMALGACESSKEEKQATKEPGTPSSQVVKGKPSDSAPADALAKVGDKYVTVAEYERQMLKFSPKLTESEPGRKYVLNQYIENILIEKEAEARGWTKDPAILSRIEEYTRSLYRNNLMQSLKETQKTVSEEEAKKYFREHEEEFIQPDRFRIGLIEVEQNKEKEINAIYRDLKAGKDFAQLAAANSKHPSSRNGGDLGFLTRKQHTHLTEVAFTMKPGEISKPFNSPAGWHIIKVLEFAKKQDIPPEEAIKKAKARLDAIETSRAFDTLMKNLRDKNNVVLFEDKLRQMGSVTQGSEQKQTPPQQVPAQKGS